MHDVDCERRRYKAQCLGTVQVTLATGWMGWLAIPDGTVGATK